MVIAGTMLQQQSMLWAVRAHLAAAVPGSRLSLVTFGLHAPDTLPLSNVTPPEVWTAIALARTLFMESRSAYGTSVDMPLQCAPAVQQQAAAGEEDQRPTLAAFRAGACDGDEYALRLHANRYMNCLGLPG